MMMKTQNKKAIEDIVFSGESMPDEILESLTKEEREYYYWLIDLF